MLNEWYIQGDTEERKRDHSRMNWLRESSWRKWAQPPAQCRGKPTEPCYLSDFISYHSPSHPSAPANGFCISLKIPSILLSHGICFCHSRSLGFKCTFPGIHIPTASLLVSLHPVQPSNRDPFPNHHTPLYKILSPAPFTPFPLIMIFGLHSKIVPGLEQILKKYV